MTGCAILTGSLAVIVVEGGAKAQKKYAHIVLNRIKWDAPAEDEDDERYKSSHHFEPPCLLSVPQPTSSS